MAKILFIDLHYYDITLDKIYSKTYCKHLSNSDIFINFTSKFGTTKMEETNDLDFKTFVSKLYTQYEKGAVFEIERDSITKALILVNTLKVLTSTDLLAVLCALNFL